MDFNSTEFIKSLEKSLLEEINLYQQYLTILKKEQQVIIKYKQDKLIEFTAQRGELCNQIAEVKQQRQLLTKQFPEYRQKKLYELVIKYLRPQDAKNIVGLIQKLRNITEEVLSYNSQMSRILGFSLRSIQGALSIIHSATQTIVQSYNRRGHMQKKYHPSTTLEDTVLTKA